VGDVITFEIPGCPPNLLNLRLHWAKLAQVKAGWAVLTKIHASRARSRVGWEQATIGDRATVKITLHRARLLDKDGAEASVKPIIDALKSLQRVKLGKEIRSVLGVGLIYDDDRLHCEWTVDQVRVKSYAGQKTIVEVRRHE
jgi:hypothetical protein